MIQDPREKNKRFNQDTISQYLSDYVLQLSQSVKAIPAKDLEDARQLIFNTRKSNGRVFAAGNGGSASISEHIGCDWHKGIHRKNLPGLMVHSLVSNTSLLTAVANDFGYESSFSYQLELAQIKSNDIVVLISSSGNSSNIVKAAEYAKANQTKVLGLTGFSGGKLRELSDVSIHVDFNNYGLVEDAHQIIMHILAQYHDFEFVNLTSK